jgi:hypothetical protein
MTPEDCRRSADLCMALAFSASEKIERGMLKQMASRWRRLAKHLDAQAARKTKADHFENKNQPSRGRKQAKYRRRTKPSQVSDQ